MTIYFYTPDQPYGDFSNFSKHGIEIEGKWYRTAEHYFQSQKFTDADYQEKIRIAFTPKDAANLGRTRQVPLRSDWEIIKDDVMRTAVRAKFSTHATLRDLLLSTGDADIVENAPGDYYWGCGADGTGKNMLGVILKEIRTELSETEQNDITP